jgi:hypothetical protein
LVDGLLVKPTQEHNVKVVDILKTTTCTYCAIFYSLNGKEGFGNGTFFGAGIPDGTFYHDNSHFSHGPELLN